MKTQSFLWQGNLIIVQMFWSLVQELMYSVYEQFEKITFDKWKQIQGYIANDLANTIPGYGFVSNLRNDGHYNQHYLMDLIMDKLCLRA